jgi:hypothetical protein
MAKDETTDELRRKERVVAAVDMPGIPAGTAGKVTFVEGLTWIRYWVRFENGVTRGSLHRTKLARPKEWADLLARRAAGLDEPEAAPSEAQAAVAADEAPADSASPAGGGASKVPAHLLERSRLARERAASKA